MGNLYPHDVTLDKLKVTNLNDQDEDPEACEVEAILNHRVEKNGKISYFVKWFKMDAAENTWEPYESFFDTKCIETYWQRAGTSLVDLLRREKELKKPMKYIPPPMKNRGETARDISGQSTQHDKAKAIDSRRH